MNLIVLIDYIVDLMSFYQVKRFWPEDFEALHKSKSKKTDINLYFRDVMKKFASI